MQKHLGVLLFLLAWCCHAHAQTTKPKALAHYEKAKNYEYRRQFQQAKSYYNKAIKSDKRYDNAYLALAKVHKLYGEKEEMVSVYEKMLKTVGDSAKYASVYLDIADVYSKKGEYAKASNYLKRYLAVADEDEKYYWRVKQTVLQMEYKQDALSTKIKGKELPQNIFRGIQFASYPVALSDSSLVVNLKNLESRTSSTVVAYSHLTKKGWSSLSSLSQNINSAADQGGCTFYDDFKKVIFTSCDRKDGYGSCDLYESVLNEHGAWSQPINLGDKINTASWESEPSVTPDGKVLYFSSRRAGGYGKEDIWVSYKVDGQWTKAVNAGGIINSKEREVTPFIHPYGNQLYYAATGDNTLGGFDIFVSLKKDSTWTKGVNLGYPINTNLHESALSFSEGGKKAFFARLTEALNFQDRASSKIFSVNIPDTLLVLEKPTQAPLPLPKEVEEEAFTFSGVLFDYGSYELKEDFKKELEQLCKVLQQDKTDVSILIEGHTDNEGTEAYNMNLSLQRAEAVRDYLLNKGIAPQRMKIKGYGATQPVFSNQTEEGRAKNRRIEVKF